MTERNKRRYFSKNTTYYFRSLLSHSGCLVEFCMAQAIQHYDIQMLHCCLIHLHVLHAERFLLHIFVIPPTA
jgi:hypothetical protein